MNISLKTIVYLIVFSTGLFSLVYQTIWQRYLTFLVGADSRSSVLTLTVFLTALSAGYYISGHFSQKIKSKELFFYGLIESIIGFMAVIFPWLFKASFTWVESGILNGMLGDVVLATLLTAIPAVLMGTTLPFLTQGLSKSFHSASKTHATIYAVNTIGACFGALLAGFVLVNWIGMANSMILIGVLNSLFGIIMMFIGRNFSVAYQVISPETEKNYHPIHVNKSAVLMVAACSGYLLIAIESYFIRLFSIATDGSIYAYPTVITAFIAAIGIGAALASKLMKYAKQLYLIIPFVVIVLWLLVYLSIAQWAYADYLLKYWVVARYDHFDFLPIFRFVVFFTVIALPVIVSSMLLPFSFHFFKNKNTTLGKTTGNLYAVSTVATLVGGLVGGYGLFNYLDIQQVFLSHFLVMIILLFAALWALKSKVRSYISAVLVLGFMLSSLCLFPFNNFNKNLALTFYFQTPFALDVPQSDANTARNWLWDWFGYDEIVSSSTRAEGIVSVFEKKQIMQNPSRMIAINGRSNSGTTGTDYQGNALLSLFPYLMTQSPKRVLVIGLGTGVTAGAIAIQSGVDKVDVCEINAAVSEQLPLFDYATFNASSNSKINIIQSDVVKYLLRSDVEYDIIVSIPSNFWVAGMENLMMPEFYSIAKSKLAKGGTYIQWIPDYDFSEQGLLTLIRSFTQAFDESSLWRLTQDDLVLMYQKQGNTKYPWVNNRLYEGKFIQAMDAIDYSNPMQLKLSQFADNALLNELAKYGKLHSLDTPILGSIALDALYAPQVSYSAENTLLNYKTVSL